MKLSFDLISDLHADSWEKLDWVGQVTSPFCVVAGDVARDHSILEETLEHLGQCYQSVFYIDGNEEHKNQWGDIGANYYNIATLINQLEGVVYLQDNVIVLNGAAIVGANGWWSWDTDPYSNPEQSKAWFCDHYKVSSYVPSVIKHLANNDIDYLASTIARLQTFPDVKKIVIATHTVPGRDLISHDIELEGTHRINCMSNNHIRTVLDEDTEHKISHWCFGHYHMPVDRYIDGIRYVNNCRGRKDTPYNKSVYYPLRIEIDV